jgi:hypothetical protein
MTFAAQVKAQLVGQLGLGQAGVETPVAPDGTEAAQLHAALRLLSKWRSALIQNTLLQHHGTTVRQGVLKGLDFLPQSAEGCHIPKLLGCYEQPLQPVIEEAIAAGYATVLNIGCAEGYYATGLARRMPGSMVHAFDLNPKAREACAALAAKNGVAERVTIGGLFSPADFAGFADRKTLVFCDIEGAEYELLDPGAAPALAGMDIIVEAHDCFRPGLSQALENRFASTHVVTRILDDGQRSLAEPPDWFCALSHLDQLLAVWEWRTGPTPWLVMKTGRPSG